MVVLCGCYLHAVCMLCGSGCLAALLPSHTPVHILLSLPPCSWQLTWLDTVWSTVRSPYDGSFSLAVASNKVFAWPPQLQVRGWGRGGGGTCVCRPLGG